MKYLLLCITLISFQTQAAEEENTISLQGLSIVGDKELPKVLYIIPWETYKATKITAPIYKSTLDEDFIFIHKPNSKN